jgi:hypothetical protein
MVIGVLLVSVSVGLAWRRHRMNELPAIDVLVTGMRIAREIGRDKPGGLTYPIFRPEVQYRYLGPGGQPLEETAWAGQWSKEEAPALRLAEKYPPGAGAVVTKNPSAAGVIRLDAAEARASGWPAWILLLLGVGFALLSFTAGRRRTRGGSVT